MKRPTNAVLLGPAHPYRGGLADFDHLLARALNRAGIPCRLYTFTLQYPSFLFPGKSQFTDAPAPEGLDITRVLNSVNPLNWIRTGLRIRRERPDLLIVRYWIPQMAPALGTVCRIARRGGTRTVAIMDNVLPHESRPMDRLLTRYMTGSLDGFVYMSREIRAQLRPLRPHQTVGLLAPSDVYGLRRSSAPRTGVRRTGTRPVVPLRDVLRLHTRL